MAGWQTYAETPRAPVNRWVAGARPRTLPASVVPVLVGTACAAGEGEVVAWRAIAAGVVALSLQIATNYANDYSDGVRGTDEVRVGPVRLVASGLASPPSVKRAAFLAFGVAGLAGLALAVAVGWPLLVVGAAAMAAGWFYTGGPKPYGYYGFGELFVFVFFGLVATAGSTYVQLSRLTGLSLLAAVPVGFLACALLVVNNLRDIPTDQVAGKRTLAVRIGDRRTRVLYAVLVSGAFVLATLCALWRWGALATLAALPLGVTVGVVLRGALGRQLIPVLAATARLQLVFGVLFAAGLWITA
jgi:1,4-dihydroxy-2-naphthoate polyprenyltransferase